MQKQKFIGILLLIILPLSLLCQNTHIRFKRITINDGLSLSSVYCIFQDSKGFLWFGTEDGLNKFDGKNFTIYRTDPTNKNSISDKWIEQIFEDNSGILWFGSRKGLSRFNPKTEIFTQYLHIATNNKSLSNDTITAIVQDYQNRLWVGTRNGLNRINSQTRKIERIESVKSELQGLSSKINILVPDRDGKLWVGTDKGLLVYDETTQEYTSVIVDENSPVSLKIRSIALDGEELWIGSNQGLIHYSKRQKTLTSFPLPGKTRDNQLIEKIHIDRNHRIWALTLKGLYQFNPQKRKFKFFIKSTDSTHSLAINDAKPFFEDHKGNLWFGTFGDGLYKISPQKEQVTRYQNSAADPKSLSENSINCIYEDRSGIIWIGTFGAGISIYDPMGHKFDLLRHNAMEPQSLSSNFVWSVMEAQDGSVWIGTNDKGISRYTPNTESYSFYDVNLKIPGSLSHSSVREIFQDSKGKVWVGTDGGGLNQFDPSSEKFKVFQSIPKDLTSLSSNSVRVIFEDKDGILWIGTRNGLNRFDPQTLKFKRYLPSKEDPHSISHNFIYSCILQDREGNLWIGTYGGGLNRMDIPKEQFTSYQYNPDSPNCLSNNMVFSLFEDNLGTLWIGTNNGLNRFVPSTGKFTRFGRKEGLPNEVIYGILPDDNNNIWLSTNSGVARFNLDNYSITSFDVNDGLQSNEFNGGAFHRGNSGKLYFGGVYGLNIITPNKITLNGNGSNIVITKLEVLGKKVQVADSALRSNIGDNHETIIQANDNYYLGENISFAQQIVLDYKHRFFSLEFSALNNPLPEKVKYAYKIDELDKDWNFAGNRNYVTYANIPPGTYSFSVKAKNANGAWSNTPARLCIIITPPFWKTWWFFLIELFLALNLAVFIYHYLLKVKTNKLLITQNEKIRTTNQKLIASEKDLKALNATKDKFFSIISHDLKNPFTSLLSISETLFHNYPVIDDKERLFGMEKIHCSVNQIYNLLENLLTWSRSQTGKLRYLPTQFSLTELIAENINLYKIQAEKKDIHLFSSVQHNITAFGDREMISTVLRNLINNAIKFSDSGSSIFIDTRKEQLFWEVIVQDQGVGISPENQKKLFRLDLKFKSKGTSDEKGTGLGLLLCKEFIEKNGGNIRIKSQIGVGSTFIFSVPINENTLLERE